MAAPNIVNVSSIIGVTTSLNLTTDSATSFVSNAASSGKVFRINTLIAVNTDGTDSVDLTIKLHQEAVGLGSSVPISSTVTVPADSSLIIIGKDNPIYLEENKSISAQASSADTSSIVCSYEEIS